jgi:hypothetical protein
MFGNQLHIDFTFYSKRSSVIEEKKDSFAALIGTIEQKIL